MKKDKLAKERIDKLDSIGFVRIQVIPWDQKFEEYKDFKEKNGRKPMESSKDKIEKMLGAWASKQIVSFNKNALSKERVDKLNSIGFVWNRIESSWNKSFRDYKRFKEYNKCEPYSESKDKLERFLAIWTNNQRARYKTDKVPKDRIDKQKSMGIKCSLKK